MTPEDAVALATQAHRGQMDQAGKPYIDHVMRVMNAAATPSEKMAAALHDVVEDTPFTLEDLRARGCPEEVVAAIDALTKRRGEAKIDYYRRVARDPTALAVKRADIADNASPVRLALLPVEMSERLQEKYARAIPSLGRADGVGTAATLASSLIFKRRSRSGAIFPMSVFAQPHERVRIVIPGIVLVPQKYSPQDSQINKLLPFALRAHCLRQFSADGPSAHAFAALVIKSPM